MKRILLLIFFLLWSAVACALPTVDGVQAEVKAGRYAQAETMMQEVVAAKPKSAKAHYVYAEILAHNGRFNQAADQVRQARELDPAIAFTDAAKFHAFEDLLQREQQQAQQSRSVAPRAMPVAPAPAPVYRERGSGLPGWIWGLGFAAIAVLIWRLIANRASAATGTTAVGPGYQGGYGGGMPMQPAPPSAGSGLLGTGIAAAGGFAAGMLAEKMLGDDHSREAHREVDRGGLQPGMFDDAPNASAAELESRSIDFGSSGDWGGDASGGGDDW